MPPFPSPRAAGARRVPVRDLVLRVARASLASLGVGLAVVPMPAAAEVLGEVSTVFKFLGPNDKIVVEAYDDPKVGGVTCYVSRARTGGIGGAVGVAEDRAEASIACRQVGPIAFRGQIPRQEVVFDERLSILFKKLHIVRIADPARNALVYLTYSDRLIEGSPKNSITAVPLPAGTSIPLR